MSLASKNVPYIPGDSRHPKHTADIDLKQVIEQLLVTGC